jgi:hypothetical protein
MKAAWYEKQGAARDVLIVGEMSDPRGPAKVVQLPEGVPLEQGACLGIPGITVIGLSMLAVQSRERRF